MHISLGSGNLRARLMEKNKVKNGWQYHDSLEKTHQFQEESDVDFAWKRREPTRTRDWPTSLWLCIKMFTFKSCILNEQKQIDKIYHTTQQPGNGENSAANLDKYHL